MATPFSAAAGFARAAARIAVRAKIEALNLPLN
jgi:hypothetical protein